jgi:hypothetical protein
MVLKNYENSFDKVSKSYMWEILKICEFLNYLIYNFQSLHRNTRTTAQKDNYAKKLTAQINGGVHSVTCII